MATIIRRHCRQRDCIFEDMTAKDHSLILFKFHGRNRRCQSKVVSNREVFTTLHSGARSSGGPKTIYLCKVIEQAARTTQGSQHLHITSHPSSQLSGNNLDNTTISIIYTL